MNVRRSMSPVLSCFFFLFFSLFTCYVSFSFWLTLFLFLTTSFSFSFSFSFSLYFNFTFKFVFAYIFFPILFSQLYLHSNWHYFFISLSFLFRAIYFITFFYLFLSSFLLFFYFSSFYFYFHLFLFWFISDSHFNFFVWYIFLVFCGEVETSMGQKMVIQRIEISQWKSNGFKWFIYRPKTSNWNKICCRTYADICWYDIFCYYGKYGNCTFLGKEFSWHNWFMICVLSSHFFFY